MTTDGLDGPGRRARLVAARLYLIVSLPRSGALAQPAVAAAVGSGAVDLVQLRDKTGDDDAFLAAARALRHLCHPRGIPLLLNDRVHLVEAAGADGVHVGEDDLDPGAARAALGDDRLLGVSTHDPHEVAAAAAGPADHAGLGPCFASASKTLERPPGGPALLLRALAGVDPAFPVFPIGGIDVGNVGGLVAAGARRAAVGAGILDASDPARAARAIAAALGAGTSGPPEA